MYVMSPNALLDIVLHIPRTAHRDTGGRLSMAIYRCRKVTIVAVNGHAVS